MTLRYSGISDFDHAAPGRIGVLLVNLGTPSAPDTASVRRYLREFLWDPRVVELPRPLWWLILNAVILRIRPSRSAKAYATVWTEQGSPLLVNSQAQTQALERALNAGDGPGPFSVALAMRYGEPSVAQGLTRLAEAGARRLVVLPLYPQYSATTTGSVFDAVSADLQRRRWIPHLAFNAGYHDDPGYIASLAASIRETRERHGPPDRLLFSFHGIPRRYFLGGDPYHCQCHATARLVAEALDLPQESFSVSFQSRVGREEWLRPYTDEVLERWGQEGVGTVHVVCPGFAADCLETLEEIAVENRERFEHAGGGRLHYIAALNDRPDHIEALASLVRRSAGDDWLAWAEGESAEAAGEPSRRARAAVAMGAPR